MEIETQLDNSCMDYNRLLQPWWRMVRYCQIYCVDSSVEVSNVVYEIHTEIHGYHVNRMIFTICKESWIIMELWWQEGWNMVEIFWKRHCTVSRQCLSSIFLHRPTQVYYPSCRFIFNNSQSLSVLVSLPSKSFYYHWMWHWKYDR